MAINLGKLRIDDLNRVPNDRLRISESVLDNAMQARYDSLGDLKGGLGPLVKKDGAFWYYQNGCLCYRQAKVFEIHGEIYKKWVKLGGKNFGRPDTDESPCADGTGRYNHFENGSKTIFWHP